ncbi:MAG: methylated-DNA--[protein]-cysteine S-methyltransferase [Anaerolineaceae bacterium]|nr:methylated-DNA--[protein]-cysteine S-methyltransferase [Anaerolineaceae bacterium]
MDRDHLVEKVSIGALYSSPLGAVSVAVSELGLRRVVFGSPADLECEFQNAREGKSPLLKAALDQLNEYFHGERKVFDLPIDWPVGSAFRLAVMQAAQMIPYGNVQSYAQLAVQAGHAGAARAVGSVMAHNPMLIVVPCHRVVASDKRLGGFSAPGGQDTKMFLLELEGLKIVDQRLG